MTAQCETCGVGLSDADTVPCGIAECPVAEEESPVFEHRLMDDLTDAREENARLRAVVEKMLAALRAAMPALESIHDPGNPILEAAYAAIAKAEGDKP
jgi:hypothetical protein